MQEFHGAANMSAAGSSSDAASAAAAASSSDISSSSPAPAGCGGVLIIGGGVAELTLALFLAQLRIPCRVFESYPRLRPAVGACLQLAPNGVAVLQLEDALRARGAMCHSYRFCNDRGECFADLPLGGRAKRGAASITLARARLHAL
jgi:2-polyprenyl-6-methoxyphenol hydroxylase-like FAD-dependent oxidoreductase